jgi:hypothetical protein
VLIWQELYGAAESEEGAGISQDELQSIGPGQYDLKTAAKRVVQICNRLLDQA